MRRPRFSKRCRILAVIASSSTSSSDSAAQLRINVTSPGGTTAEALKVLMAGDAIQPLFDRAIDAATRRSRELAG